MVLEAGANNLLAVVKVLRADEADHTIDQQRIEGSRNRVSARLASLLIDAAIRIGRKRRSLPGFEIHHIAADTASPQRHPRLVRLAQQFEIYAEAAVGSLRPRDRLEDQIHRRALLDQTKSGRHMRENATLGRNLQPRNDVVEQAQQTADDRGVVACRIDADAGVAGPEQDAIEDGCGDALLVIERMV